MENTEINKESTIEIDGVKYKKLAIHKMLINDIEKSFISSDDTKSNSVNMKIIIK